MTQYLLLIGVSWLSTLGWLAGLAVGFGVLVRLMPCNPGMYWWKDLRAVATDFIYWFIVPLFLNVCRALLLTAGVVLLFGGRQPNLLPVNDLPLWLQCFLILLIQDVMLYWIHRLFHTRPAWKFHAVHHSPKILDWMSTARFHPINNLLSFALADVAVLLLGFPSGALVVLVPFNIIYSAMVHANLNWTFGPLRYLFASPVFHRWHHTTQEEGLDKNFAPTFPFLDVFFGTFYMPPGKLPAHFGTGEPDFPVDFWGQLLHPFKSRTAVLITAGGLTAVCLMAGGLYMWAWRKGGNELLEREREAKQQQWAQLQPQRGEARRPGIRFDLPFGPPILGVALSADGRSFVAGAHDGTVTVWDAGAGRQTLWLARHTRGVRSVGISSDGNVIAWGGYDRALTVWDAQTRQVKFTYSGKSAVLSVAVSADSKRVVAAFADGSLKAWDVMTAKETLSLTKDAGAITSVAISGDGGYIAWASEKTVTVWDVQAGREKHVLKGHTNLVYAVAIGPDGATIVSGSFDETVKVWDGATGELKRTLTGHRGPVYSVAITPDSKRIISAGKDRTVKVWNAVTGKENRPLTGHRDAVTSVSVSGDGCCIVSGSQDGTIKVWADPDSGPKTRTAQSSPPPLLTVP